MKSRDAPRAPHDLLRFTMHGMGSAGVAKLLELQPSRGFLLILRRRIISILALVALQSDDISHVCSTQGSTKDPSSEVP